MVVMALLGFSKHTEASGFFEDSEDVVGGGSFGCECGDD